MSCLWHYEVCFFDNALTSPSCFWFQYLFFSFSSSSSCFRLLPRLLFQYIFPFIFLPITCFGRRFLGRMWPLLFRVRSAQLILSILFYHHISKLSSVSDLFSEAYRFQHLTDIRVYFYVWTSTILSLKTKYAGRLVVFPFSALNQIIRETNISFVFQTTVFRAPCSTAHIKLV